MKRSIFILFLFLDYYSYSQDTLTTEEFNSRSEALTGKFIVLGLQSMSTVITGLDTTITIYRSNYYRIGELKKGKLVGVWESYKIGHKHDTLFWRSTYQNDTLLSSAQYYPNGNVKILNKYILTRLVSSEHFLSNGKKYLEQQFTDCKMEYTDYEAVEIGYYGNGKLKYIGKLKCANRKVTYYDNWYYYSDKGELYKIIRYFETQPPDTVLFKIKGKYFEWYEEKQK